MGEELSNREIISFCRQMAMIFQSGIPALEGIHLMMEESASEEDSFRKTLEDLKLYMEEMGIFSFALKETGSFPEYVISMVELGESTGTLDEVMEGLARYYEREENLLWDIKNACTYPMMMMGMMLVIIAVLLMKVIPVFGEVYQQMGSQMSGMAGALLSIGSTLAAHQDLVFLVCIFLLAAILWLLKSKAGLSLMEKAGKRYMKKSQILHKISVSRFALITSMALRSGMGYDRAFEMVRQFMKDDSLLSEQVDQCEAKMQEGISLGQACQASGMIGGIQGRMLRISEQAGQTEEALLQISRQMDQEVSDKINTFISALEPTLVVILSVLVGVILLSVMMPLMGILSNIG